MSEREGLIANIRQHLTDSPYEAELIADFIIADRKRIVEPLVKIPSQDRLPMYEWISFATDGINHTLKNAGYEQ